MSSRSRSAQALFITLEQKNKTGAFDSAGFGQCPRIIRPDGTKCRLRCRRHSNKSGYKWWRVCDQRRKCWITNASYARTVIVTAVTGKTKTEKHHLRIDRASWHTGLTITSPYDKMGVRGSNTAEILLEDVRVPAGNLLGDPTKVLSSFYIRWTADGSPSSLLQSASPKRHLKHHWHTRKNESSSDSRFLPFRRFNLSLPTWRWKLIWPGKWC